MSLSHDELVDIGYNWLLGTMNCGFAIKEMSSFAGEEPDVIGFRNNASILIECKASRSDFLAESNKFYRRNPEWGMGNYRYYLCEPDLIKEEDLPDKWGLLYYDNGIVKKIYHAYCPGGHNIARGENKFNSQKLYEKERRLMYSALRRLNENHPDIIEEMNN